MSRKSKRGIESPSLLPSTGFAAPKCGMISISNRLEIEIKANPYTALEQHGFIRRKRASGIFVQGLKLAETEVDF